MRSNGKAGGAGDNEAMRIVETTKCGACGALLVGTAKYCSQCGASHTVSTMSATPCQANRGWLNRALEAVLWLAIVGTSSALFFTTRADGHNVAGRPEAGRALFGLVLWCYLLAKVRRLRNAWLYALAGLGLAFLIICVALFVSKQ
jgi:hypothetical protein